jgi:Predicted membrane protein (DUF2232)
LSSGETGVQTIPDRRGLAMEIAAASAISVLFFLAVLLVPVVGMLSLPLAAIPAVRLGHRYGASVAGVSCVAAAGVNFGIGAALGVSAASAAALVAGVTFLPALFAAVVRRGVPHSRAFAGLCLAGLLPVAGLALAETWGGEGAVAEEIGTFDQMIPSAMESSRRSLRDPIELERVRRTLLAARDFARRFWPGLIGASWVLGAAVSFYGGSRAARPSPSAEASRYETLRAPAPAAVLFVLAGAGAALLAGSGRSVAGNVLLPLAALFFVTGLSIICHFARKWFRVRILRIGLYALFVYVFPMNLGVALLGLFDWYADFRRRGEGATEKS